MTTISIGWVWVIQECARVFLCELDDDRSAFAIVLGQPTELLAHGRMMFYNHFVRMCACGVDGRHAPLRACVRSNSIETHSIDVFWPILRFLCACVGGSGEICGVRRVLC